MHSKIAKNKLKNEYDKRNFEQFILNKKNYQNGLNEKENNTLLKTNILVSQKIMYHIKDFFINTYKKEKTKKNKKLMNRLTRKK